MIICPHSADGTESIATDLHYSLSRTDSQSVRMSVCIDVERTDLVSEVEGTDLVCTEVETADLVCTEVERADLV